MKTEFKWVQTSLVLVPRFLRQLLKFEEIIFKFQLSYAQAIVSCNKIKDTAFTQICTSLHYPGPLLEINLVYKALN